MAVSDSQKLWLRWLIVCLIPLLTLLVFALFPPPDQTQYFINGIILACEATFLFKFVLFGVIHCHLRQDFALKRKNMLLFIPIIALIVYLFHYYGVF
ncbi:hypothetical protein L4G92_06465 [Neisseria sp. ZJ106]|uniref:Cytochrome C oxidase subunit IV n=1 Tax=Neisseria lisongii TaxID=2912188 RepID=A0AAW5AGJ7_9NEIS|nr:hypothetical protein [Neisseria lisongii]MCF7521690.1 hypothetical protein [Neisseria lisongii]MCF7528746.1 hypothetical protein [Neisseria lisongii]MCF7529604.1 hypothetical protein [Neisseria lisongii]WCL72224.1 hypothetical protein PJU73_03725 [Neisseria lisongii]